jgi:hypothetical protein
MMFRKTLIAISVLVSTSLAAHAAVPTCSTIDAPGWSNQLKQLFADCVNSVASPNGAVVFQVGLEQQIHISAKGRDLVIGGNDKLELPAVLSWAPNSEFLIINDGNGSGLSSQLRLFVISVRRVSEKDVSSPMVRIYRARNHCGKSTQNPNTYGVAWVNGGKSLYAIAQATVNDRCGSSDRYLGFVLDVATQEITQVLSTEQAKSLFKPYLPKQLR